MIINFIFKKSQKNIINKKLYKEFKKKNLINKNAL